jgi:hypothetical protein
LILTGYSQNGTSAAESNTRKNIFRIKTLFLDINPQFFIVRLIFSGGIPNEREREREREKKKILTISVFIVAVLSLSSCNLLESEEGKRYSLKFKLDGVQREFKTYEDSAFYQDTDGSWLCNWHDGGEQISLYIKQTPTAGTTYTTGFTFTYVQSESDFFWNKSGSFDLTITQWGTNKGDIQKGEFASTLSNEQVITEGTFEAEYTDNY